MSLGELVRRADPDRYFCTLFAPAEKREVLFTLYAFNHELARACEVTREPGLALIRLQWWREVVEGEAKAHEVATPLHRAIAAGELDQAILLDMIAARDREAEAGFDTLAEWLAWLKQGAGSVMVAAAVALGAPADALVRVRELGAAYGVAGQIRNVPALAAQGRCLLPANVCARWGITPEAIIGAPQAAAVRPVLGVLGMEGKALLCDGLTSDPAWRAAVLPVILARNDLRRPSPRSRGVSDRIAIVAAAARGRRAVVF